MTQAELGEKLGLNFAAIHKYEAGIVVPPPDKLITLAELFGVSVAILLGEERPPQTLEEFVLRSASEQLSLPVDTPAATPEQRALKTRRDACLLETLAILERLGTDRAKLDAFKRHLEDYRDSHSK